ncbi:carbohydrate ABC transporter membrane protein 1, CUT1 family [Paramicrobacterium humi]|uniref:Carbohydrate ABC transporter membrane protein 1, CUT1 family n=1 Tax=Paramicrobacterium humi TaxID=640635 RepID=A0A1H4L3L1_9MICO|nr:sugar ABC transporter permease [Microbacterium humi]SEB65076.1 carbohydrate ABC transporter membrane protein 1, CUT1 family [Microbacterium humi]
MTETARVIGARRAAGSSSPLGARTGGNAIDRGRKKLFVPFVGPAFLFYTILFVVPALYAVWISFNKWAGAGPMEFVGLKNYVRLFSDKLFMQSFVNTLLLLFVVGIAIFVIAFGLTLVLRDMVGRKIARSVIFFPHLVNAMIFGVLAGFIFNPGGLVNTLLGGLGVTDPPAWLSHQNMFPLIMVMMTWITTGYFTTILMAGVDRIPPYYYEDCALAGANAWQRLRYVILPLTWDVFGTCAVLWTISSVKIFEIIWVFGGSTGQGMPPTQTWTTAVYTYVTAFSGESIPAYGAATASAVLSLALVSVLVVLLRRALKRDAVEF